MTATFAITHDPPVALIVIRGELDVSCRGILAWRLVELASLDCPTVRVDLRDVTHIDACCLRLLDDTRRHVTARQARFVVTHASTYVALVAELAGFHGLAPCAATAKKLQPTGGPRIVAGGAGT
jgi:anti-anti-sigma factor